MKKILLILSLFTLLLSCQQKSSKTSGAQSEESSSLFFSSDSTVFGAINVRQSIAVKDSLLQTMGFKKKHGYWIKEQMKFIHLTNVAFKIVVEDKEQVKEISQKIMVLPIHKVSENFLFGIQMKQGQPFQEVFFTQKKNKWELKVFPRNRL